MTQNIKFRLVIHNYEVAKFMAVCFNQDKRKNNKQLKKFFRRQTFFIYEFFRAK
jgi:hypothetical protein